MQDHIADGEFNERFALIERMIAEGRRNTESWGWTFVLWGVAYYAAIAWSAWDGSVWAWPATIATAVTVTMIVASLKTGRSPATTLARAIGSIWIAAGISMVLLFPALGLSGRLTDQHLFATVLSAILGLANGASALILRWHVQFACAVVWWIAAVATCFGSDAQSTIVFLVAIFLCQIAFGIYGIICKPHRSARRSPADV